MTSILSILSRTLAGGALILALGGPAHALDLGVSIGSINANANVGVNRGIDADVAASIGGRNGINAAADASVGNRGINAGLDATVGGPGGIAAAASLGVGSGVNLGVDVGIGRGGGTGGGGGGNASNGSTGGSGGATIPSSAIARLSGTELMQMRRRCVEITANASLYDRDLVSLCSMIQQASR